MLTRNCLLLFLWLVCGQERQQQSSASPIHSPPIQPPLPLLPQSRLGRERPRHPLGGGGGGQLGGQRHGNGGGGGGNGAFQRVKRGWVWNQFFVLEEYMGSEPQYVGKLHTDLDKGESAVKYTLNGDGAGSIFTIDQTTGDIHALRSLDREEKPYYTLRAQAVDMDTGRALEPESEFIIKVQDINDNEPKFLDGPYTGSVPEMSQVGTYVMTVTATDADDPTYGMSARVVYSIIHGQPYFSVDPKTGDIRTALPNMDREVREVYQVLIQAKDMGGQLGGLAGTTTVNITLSDVNDNPPRFAKSIFHVRVPESSAVGSSVGRIKAHDLDTGKNAEVEYNIVPGDGGAMFDITTNEHNQEGILLLKRPLDYESKKAYTFKVEASNAHVDPRFQNLGPFKDMATVKVIISRYMMYSIDWKSDLDSFFDIDPVKGTISTNELLDRESIAQHNISIVATKINSPVLTSRAAVTVHVNDVNEFPPEFAMPYETFVCENAKIGQVIQVVSAKDQDLPPAGQKFTYRSAQDESEVRNFTVRDFGNNTAGIVTLRGGFRRRVQEFYEVAVVIADSGSGYRSMSSTGTLSVRVCVCDSDGSLLTCNAEALFLPVGLSTGALIAILLCIIILLVMVVLYVGVRRQKEKETLMTSKEDVRDNVIHYDDEGGGEEDTHAFDMGTLRNPVKAAAPDNANQLRRDIRPDLVGPPPLSSSCAIGDAADIRSFLQQRLERHDADVSAPPYDSLATYAYEGEGSVAESLSSIQGGAETDEDFDYLNEWGPRFRTLAGIFGERSESQSDLTAGPASTSSSVSAPVPASNTNSAEATEDNDKH
ncbi:cadherin-12-like [Engraulis encrasicolus]|uniref:cadherin-12-like n=1 Tax=Engraulis encrasicolus TaxID=184585 RepID=UPI002FD4888B